MNFVKSFFLFAVMLIAPAFAGPQGSDTFLTGDVTNVANLAPVTAPKASDAWSVRVGNGWYQALRLDTASAYVKRTMYAETTFVDSVRGFSTIPTVTISCTRVVKQVSCFVPPFTGTSNATTLTLDAWPSGWRPNAATALGGLVMTDNTSTTRQTAKVILATNGVPTFTFSDDAGVSAAWTGSGTKALANGFQLTFIKP